jgi:hypothetical protein
MKCVCAAQERAKTIELSAENSCSMPLIGIDIRNLACSNESFGEIMKTTLPLGWLLAVLGGLTATGCIASSEDESSVLEAPPMHTDAIQINAIQINAIQINAIQINALLSSSLTQDALLLNTQTGGPLEDPSARQLFSYIVSCALPEGQELTYTDTQGTAYTFDGSLGIAPQWGAPGGNCNEVCQQWVSGCVLSRVDYLGQHVSISLRGLNPALKASPTEMQQYTHREATYYGNIFSQPQRLLACLAPGETSDPRVCGPSIENCGIEFQGSCDQVCGAQLPDGSFAACRGPADRIENGQLIKPYLGSVTTFLQ